MVATTTTVIIMHNGGLWTVKHRIKNSTHNAHLGVVVLLDNHKSWIDFVRCREFASLARGLSYLFVWPQSPKFGHRNLPKFNTQKGRQVISRLCSGNCKELSITSWSITTEKTAITTRYGKYARLKCAINNCTQMQNLLPSHRSRVSRYSL